MEEFGRTIFVVLHDINFAARYVNDICAVKESQIAYCGTVEEIMDAEKLIALFNTPIMVSENPVSPFPASKTQQPQKYAFDLRVCLFAETV
ncbi:Iron(3+)-hydroxamate import ATP-binding protein FhuC [Corynebacterium felinum]|uniref:ABC-type enterochelin transport system ATPase subunit n=1 Tax=Corynebacterium felinum TaxID=131318 RepID=A0ABU2B8Q1_9CORY|nr:ABC-type enterochelin transport system ATPase subunit [Corynebacterium felinum]WJY94345.1 Iron(3+)-hydroxamate import ATP-binding protein FhuC [Corynebacterium felinum]